MSDPKLELESSLTEVVSTVDSIGNGILGELFSGEALSITMGKIFALESFLNLATRDCKYNEFIREILTIITQTIKSEAGSILEIDQSNQSLFFRAVNGRSSEQVVNFIIPPGQGIVGHVIESRAPIVVDNIPENTVHLKSIEKAVGFETRNMVALPILIRGRVYGVVEVLNRMGESNYSATDVEILTYLCQMASKVIEIRLMIAWVYKPHGSTADPGDQ